MTLDTEDALHTILDMDTSETQRFLMMLLERNPSLFNAIEDDIAYQDFFLELFEEMHNGQPMYPELHNKG